MENLRPQALSEEPLRQNKHAMMGAGDFAAKP